MAGMKIILQDALDDLVSSRSSSESKSNALSTLERLLAWACVPTEKPDEFYTFVALQDAFECNVPSRLLAWITSSTSKLELLTNKGSMDHGREAEASALSSQLCLSLSIIQGILLNHGATKRYLGRRYALEVLLDLFLASRHLSSMPNSAPPGPGVVVHLSSVVLDTVLCILVDSSPALRAFEESKGVQAVVKILKRAGTPREVRMKCLEFLYFYLLDETSPASIAQEPTPPPTAPATPLRTADARSRAFAPRGSTSSHSRYGSDLSLSFVSNTSFYTPTGSSFSTSTASSFSSTSSNASSFTNVTKPSASPPTAIPPTGPISPTATTPPRTPPLPFKQPRSLFLLRKEVDFVPLSPKKPAALRIPNSPTKQDSPRSPKKTLCGITGREKSFPRPRFGSRWEDENHDLIGQDDGDKGMADDGGKMMGDAGRGTECESEGWRNGKPVETKIRTTEEKRQILGSMFGNVDALVEGVRKAGIWGLG